MKRFALITAALVLTACANSAPPEESRDQLSKHIQQPLDKAKSVETLQQQGAAQRQQQLEAAEQ
ncbi:hypothetical protein CO613_06875 [Lysobacteraceae bacterium NML07-0707]|nr:hypothetical protein CO613_06875 [Xanthomonadaceae bacterium NML07-0707]